MKGIILAGGSGTRLSPMTKYMNKHLLNVYDKPMFFYPLSILLLLGIKDIAIVCDKSNEKAFKKSLPVNIKQTKIQYFYQDGITGIPDAVLAAKDFIDNKDFFLILGDNIFFGMDLISLIRNSINREANLLNAICFSYPVSNPERFGVVLRHNNIITKIVEKPKKFLSNEVITGMYSFPKTSMQYFKNLKKSLRGETEITDVLLKFKNKNKLHVEKLGKGHFWMDVGTPESLLEAANFISIVQKRQGLKIADIYSLI